MSACFAPCALVQTRPAFCLGCIFKHAPAPFWGAFPNLPLTKYKLATQNKRKLASKNGEEKTRHYKPYRGQYRIEIDCREHVGKNRIRVI
jgi:hypothetical protein